MNGHLTIECMWACKIRLSDLEDFSGQYYNWPVYFWGFFVPQLILIDNINLNY